MLPLLPLVACSPAVAVDDAGGRGETSGDAEDSDSSDSEGSSGPNGEGPVTDASGDATSSPMPSDESTTQDPTSGGDTGPTAMCGDGIVDGDEVCDDGNDDPGDGCAPGCVDEPGWVVSHHVSDTVNAQFTAIDLAEDGSVVVAGAELELLGDAVTGLVARYDAEGTLLGRSPLALDVATYPREVVDIGGGDALVVVATGPEFYSPASQVQLLRISPGASQPSWILDLFAGQTARASRGVALDGDGVILGLSSYDAETESQRLLRVTLDGEVDWDIELDAGTDGTELVHVMRDAGVVHVMVCHVLVTDYATDCELRQVGDGGALTGGIAWSFEGIAIDATMVGETVVLAGYGPAPDFVAAVWAWTAGEPAWSLTEERVGIYRSIATADDGSLVVAGFMEPDDDIYDELLYRRLDLDGTVLDAPEAIAQHSGVAVARRGGTSVIAGELHSGTFGDLLATDGWLHSTGD
jgi:cysteine-rich repeat protein